MQVIYHLTLIIVITQHFEKHVNNFWVLLKEKKVLKLHVK